MRRPRLGSTLAALALALLAAVLAVGVPRAAAIDPFPVDGIATLHSDHFMIHYSRVDKTTVCPTQFITQLVQFNQLQQTIEIRQILQQGVTPGSSGTPAAPSTPGGM